MNEHEKAISVAELYERLKIAHADMGAITTAMQQITGDATPRWEDSVMSAAHTNVVLHTLYGRYKRLRDNLAAIMEQEVTIVVYQS